MMYAVPQLDWQVVESRAQAVIALDPANPDAINYLAAAERASVGSGPQPTSQPATSSPFLKLWLLTIFAGTEPVSIQTISKRLSTSWLSPQPPPGPPLGRIEGGQGLLVFNPPP